MTTLGVLLAGGLSRRMGGGDKGLMPLGGKPLMGHALDRLAAQTDDVIINANGDPNRFAAFSKPVVPDTIAGFAGPLAGVLAAMRYARERVPEAKIIISAAADTPFFPNDLVATLQSKAETTNTVVLAASDGRRHPVFGLWPVSLADDLDQWLSDESNRKVLAWVDHHRWTTADFASLSRGNTTLDPFFNINTPEDLDKASELVEQDVA